MANLTPLHEQYRRFFELVARELALRPGFAGSQPRQERHLLTYQTDVPGVRVCSSFAQRGRLRADLLINHSDGTYNKRLFDTLHGEQSQIEAEFGERLSWERLDGKRVSKVAVYKEGVEDLSSAMMAELLPWATDRMTLLHRVLVKRLLDRA